MALPTQNTEFLFSFPDKNRISTFLQNQAHLDSRWFTDRKIYTKISTFFANTQKTEEGIKVGVVSILTEHLNEVNPLGENLSIPLIEALKNLGSKTLLG